MNIEDTRLGVAEYVVEVLGVETVELKGGQGAKLSVARSRSIPWSGPWTCTRLYRHS